MRKSPLLPMIRKFFDFENFASYKGKYKNFFSLALMFKKFSLNKQKCERKYKKLFNPALESSVF